MSNSACNRGRRRRASRNFTLLARLGEVTRHEGRGLGHGLLADLVARTAELGNEIGYRGLVVHAEDEAARAFYLHALPGFEASPVEPLHLVLLMKDIRAALRS